MIWWLHRFWCALFHFQHWRVNRYYNVHFYECIKCGERW